MAKLTSLFSFSGSLDGISVYKMEGVDKPIMRKKGGPKKEKILHDPGFVNTRREMEEFGGRSAATRCILEAFAPLRPGHGTTGRINKLLASLQKMDSQSKWGQRAITLSLCPGLLQGLDISKRLTLGSIVQHSFSCGLSKQTNGAFVDLPALLPGVNCNHPKLYSFFRVIAVLGVIPDLHFQDKLDAYAPHENFQGQPPQVVQTDWQQTNRSSMATRLELSLPQAASTEGYSLQLSIALQYGKLGPTGMIEPAPKAIASKILAVV
jgi:hypothetical protein